MRHGPAEPNSASGLDDDRALSDGGRKRVQAVTEVLLQAAITPDLIVTSPLVRTVQTAEIVHATLAARRNDKTTMPPIHIHRALAPGNAAGAVFAYAIATATALAATRILLIGHEPDMTARTATIFGAKAAEVFRAIQVHGFAPATVIGGSIATVTAAAVVSGKCTPQFVIDGEAPRYFALAT
jgi:phosphohistidine phosphatase